MKKRNVNLIQGNYGRIKEISDYCGVFFDKVLNVSLIFGISEYWYKIVKIVNQFPGCCVPENKNYESGQELFATLGKKIEIEYEKTIEVETLEKEFDEIYPAGYFEDLEIRHKEFLKIFKDDKGTSIHTRDSFKILY